MGSLRRILALGASALLVGTLLANIETPKPAQALNASDFDPGFIISDALFYDRGAMTEAQIQQFLDQRIGVCENSNCLNVYRQTTRNLPATERCTGGYQGAANERASTIIFKIQQSCGISAKVILVTLQKEQSLITSKRPSTATLERAMGYYCPDDPNRPGWCAPEFAGFFNQVMNASAQFQRYRLYPNSFSHRVGTQQVRYHPNPACGSRTVTIKNAATAGLYNYTPYTPNQAAMNNLFGVGDSCSAYGNRNFWRIYNEWFGSPTGTVAPSATVSRLWGEDRYGTSVAIAKDTFPAGAPVVYVAVGSSFPDGLSAAPAAVRAGGPLLLTAADTLPQIVQAEIQRLQPQRIVVVGGSGAVSDLVYQQLSGLAPEIRRDSGADRYTTAEAVARAGFPDGATIAFVASGGDFPDALSASAAAGALSGPVVLVPPGSRNMPESTRELIRDLGVRTVVIVGGTGVIPDGSFVDSIRSIGTVTTVSRQAGANRYSTSAAINAYAFPTTTTAYIASGRNFPDALSAAAAAGMSGAALHLSPGQCLPVSSAAHLASAKVSTVKLLGGVSVIANPPQSLQPCR